MMGFAFASGISNSAAKTPESRSASGSFSGDVSQRKRRTLGPLLALGRSFFEISFEGLALGA